MLQKASNMTLQTAMYLAVSLHPRTFPFPYPRRVPEYFIFAFFATFAMQLLKNFLVDFIVWRLILKIEVSTVICYKDFFYTPFHSDFKLLNFFFQNIS